MLNSSTITTWGQDGEVEAFRNMLTQFPNGLVACVSDSYNIYQACEKVWGDELRDLVVSRGDKGCLVIRPDSGDPATVVVEVTKQAQNICITFEQCWTNVEDVGPTLYKCYTNVLCLVISFSTPPPSP